MDDGHGASPTSILPVGRTTGRFVHDICQQMPHQVCIAVSGPQGGVHGGHVGSLGQREGPPVRISAIQEVLQKVVQSPGVQMILIAPLQETASWFPEELLDLSQEDPIPLCVEGKPLLTQDVTLCDGGIETRHYRPSNLHMWAILVSKGHYGEAAEMLSKAL